MLTSTVLLLSVCVAASEAPQPPEEQRVADATPVEEAGGGPFKLRYDRKGDPLVTGFTAAAWIATEAISKPVLAPSACRLCERDQTGASRINALDVAGRNLRWALEDQHTADTLSNVSGFALLPVSVIALDVYLAHHNGVLGAAPQDLVIIAQSAALALLLNQAVKFVAGRERPFVHVLTDEERRVTHNPTDNNLSFFSGHSTFVFSITVAAATVAELRGYERSWLVWAVGVPLAASTVYLRMAADKHYLSDVLVGTAVGTAFGVGIPVLFHGRAGPYRAEDPEVSVQLVPSGNGAALVGTF